MKYRLQRIEEIQGQQAIFKLIVDGKCQFDEFTEQIKKESNFSNELDVVQARLEDVSQMRSLPSKKFKDITPKNEINKEYEIKTQNLRIYLTHLTKTGKIIIFGGQKNKQAKDIRQFRKVKKDYFKTLGQKKT